MNLKRKIVKSGIYRHYKGHYYQVLGVARHSETEEILVVYLPLYLREGPRMCVRPFDMFFESVEVDGKTVPRFDYIGLEIPADQLPTLD